MQKEDPSNSALLNPINQMPAENEFNEEQRTNNAHFKQAQTTQLTKSNFPRFLIPGSSFKFGHNTVIQKVKKYRTQTTERGEDSDTDSQHSDVSFEERIKFQHLSPMKQSIANFFVISNQIKNKQALTKNLISQHKNTFQTIQMECLKTIELNHGKLELQRIKILIRFLNRNQQLFKVYEQLLISFPKELRPSLYFLLKQCLTLYLEAKPNLKKINQKKQNQESIEQYIDENLEDILKRFRSCQKITIIAFKKQHQGKSYSQNSKTSLQNFLKVWLQSIILCAEGFPKSRYCQQDKNVNRMRDFDSSSSDENQSWNSQGEIKKKIKKW